MKFVIVLADQFTGGWWNGEKMTFRSKEAKIYCTREEAEVVRNTVTAARPWSTVYIRTVYGW